MECQCSLPAEKENRLQACVKQLETSHSTREQLLTPLLLSRHRYLFAEALKRDKTCWIKFLIDCEFRHLWVRATLIYLQAAATFSFSLLSSFKCPYLCVWMAIILLACSQCPSWVKLMKNGHSLSVKVQLKITSHIHWMSANPTFWMNCLMFTTNSESIL